MQEYEYKVLPAPDRGEKARGAKTAGDRYAQAMTSLLNRMAQEGWDYVRADMLPSEERSGLTRRTTVYHHMLVFRRGVAAMGADAPPAPRQLTTDAPVGKAPRLEGPAAELRAEAARDSAD
jgi:Domain of unknown function (DUF4177)